MPPSPKEESKGGDTHRDTVSNPTTLALIRWGTGRAFEEDLAGWMEGRAEIFKEKVEPGDEQPLEWGSCFSEYCTWLDEQLSSFCAENDMSPKEVSSAMAESMEEHGDEFFPTFMSITEYNTFREHMVKLAERRERERDAAEAREEGEESGGGNISGTWVADPDKYDPEQAERALAHGGCPWVYKKVLKRAARFIKDVTVTQASEGITFAFTIHLFGTTVNYIPYDETIATTNLWGKPLKTRCPRPEPGQDGVAYEQFENPGIPADTKDTSRWFLQDDGQTLVWESSVYRPDLDKLVVYSQYLRRKDGGSRK
ncbi:hypothetical protein TeGR_g9798 [Tetraparma gracilis]|uniref:BART domain-containing protein n=1 Tax=Tetraparma gracilis TaxID=2962635 RepID=A0ABQ6MBM6_9STRA|nr:hypothetical protein TeGR_g9798 [Tetraparma gracilis]